MSQMHILPLIDQPTDRSNSHQPRNTVQLEHEFSAPSLTR